MNKEPQQPVMDDVGAAQADAKNKAREWAAIARGIAAQLNNPDIGRTWAIIELRKLAKRMESGL